MIVVDSSVWIDFFNGQLTPQTSTLLSIIGNEPLLVGDLILCEILQGARTEAHARVLEEELGKFHVVEMLNPELAVAAAKDYRTLRAEGIKIRKTMISSSARSASPTGTRFYTMLAILVPWRLTWASRLQ